MAKDRSKKYHDRIAGQYDQIYDDPYWRFHDELTWRLIKPWLPQRTNAACCDLGCGTGKWGLKLLKSGYPVTFVDHAPAMIEQVRQKLVDTGSRSEKASLFTGDIINMPMLPDATFSLIVAMGDPLSICSDPMAAAREMFRITQPNGVIIATADNKLAALDHYVQRGNLDALEAFVRSSKTAWLTSNQAEQFELTTFTPATLQKLFEKARFEVIAITGKTILPARQNKHLLTHPDALRRLLKLESTLAKDPSSAARAAHLQIVARHPSAGTAT